MKSHRPGILLAPKVGEEEIRISLTNKSRYYRISGGILISILTLSAIIRGHSNLSSDRYSILWVGFLVSVAWIISIIHLMVVTNKRNRNGYEISISRDGIGVPKKDLFLQWSDIESVKIFSIIGLNQLQLIIRPERRDRLRSYEPRAQYGTVSIGTEAVIIDTKPLAISTKELYQIIERFSQKKIR